MNLKHGIVDDSKKKIVCTLDSIFMKEVTILLDTVFPNGNKFKNLLRLDEFYYLGQRQIMVKLIERNEKNLITWLGGKTPDSIKRMEDMTKNLYRRAPLTDVYNIIQMLSVNKTSIESVIILADRDNDDVRDTLKILVDETPIKIIYTGDIVKQVSTMDFDVFIDDNYDRILGLLQYHRITRKSFILLSYHYNFEDFNRLILKNGITIEDFLLKYGSELGLLSPIEYTDDDRDFG